MDCRAEADSNTSVGFSMSSFSKRKRPTFCGPIAIYAQRESGLPHRFSFSPSLHLLEASRLAALILGAVLTPLYCNVGARRCCGQGRVRES